MTKIVINTCFGGFGLSDKAFSKYLKLKNFKFKKVEEKVGERTIVTLFRDLSKGYAEDAFFSEYDIPRDDSELVKVVEELGKKANGEYANLKIVEIPNDVLWYIHEYDGREHVAEKHRIWD